MSSWRDRVEAEAAQLRLKIDAFELRKMGLTRYDWSDPYHLALNLNWPTFLLAAFLLQLAINAAFATVYVLAPGAIANPGPALFVDAVFLGFGTLAPGSLAGHAIASVQLFSEVAFSAVLTGLCFGRFARPKAKILYAERAVVGVHEGVPSLMIRMANPRTSLLVDASALMTAMVMDTTLEGERFRRPRDLRLKTDHFPVFALTWTLIHPLDEQSPLFGSTPESLAARDIRIYVSVSARDESLSADVHDVHGYHHSDIAFGMRYVSAMSWDDRGRTIADLRRLSQIEPIGPGTAPVPAMLTAVSEPKGPAHNLL